MGTLKGRIEQELRPETEDLINLANRCLGLKHHAQPTFNSEETGQDSSPPLGELEGAGRLTKESWTTETTIKILRY